ncbi:MAG TPA: histidine kinase, partial [Candidatus Eisenbacteria bacterium]
MTDGHRLRRALAVAGVLATLGIGVPRVLTHTPYARLGVTLMWTPQGNARVERVLGPPAQGLLRHGDMLLLMNGAPFRRPPATAGGYRMALPKQPITFRLLRGGRPLEVTVPPARLTIWQRVRFLLFQLLALVAAVFVAFALVWRRPDLGTAAVFLWFAALQTLSAVHETYRNPEVEPTGAFRIFMGAYAGLVCWAPAAFLHFLAVFPRARWRAGRRRNSVWFWLVAAAYLTPLYFVWQLVKTGQRPEQSFMVFESVALALGVVSLVERYGGPARGDWNPSRSQRALALAAAALYLSGAILSWLLEGERGIWFFQFSLVRILVPIVGVGLLVTPFLIAFLIARDPAFDPRRILERSLPYALLSGVLAALYLILVVLGQHLFAEITGEQAMVFNVVAALILAFAFAPLKERLQLVLDRLFRRDPRALRAALDQAGRELLGALDADEIRASVEAGITRGLGRPAPIEWPEHGTPVLAPRDELPEEARPAVENLLRQAAIRLENLALQRQRAAAERRAVELSEAAARAELRALHAQVQPHFLFNALNALSYLTETDPKAAQRFTERLADMLRYTVEAGERRAALLSDEIGFVE